MAEERVYEIQELGAKFDPSTGKRMYDNYQVLRVLPQTEEDLNVLRFLEKGDSYLRVEAIIGSITAAPAITISSSLLIVR
jgi:hypothetical protein